MEINEAKVLIIDDEAEVLEMFLNILENAGFNRDNISLADDGNNAEKALNTKIFDLVISDLFFNPPLNGLELLNGLRAGNYRKENRGIPYLLLSGKMNKEYKKKRKSFTPSAFATKPIKSKIFIQIVVRMLYNHSRAARNK